MSDPIAAPAVSVIIPAYNKAETLREILVPLLEQERLDQPYEVLVVDNGSTDGTLPALNTLQVRYPHLHVLTEPRKGAGAARNRGILAARGDLLIFLDDDVLVQRDHIAQHLALHAAQPMPTCIVVSVVDRSTFDFAPLGRYVRERDTIAARGTSRTKGLSLVSQNFSVRRSALDRVRFEADGRVQFFDERFYKRQDGEFGHRLEKLGVPFLYTDAIVCEHRQQYRAADFANRAYFSGYHLQRLFAKHPELPTLAPHKIILSPMLNLAMLVAGVVAFAVGYLLQPLTPWLMFKGIGAWLLYHSNRGYQRALREHEQEAGSP